MDIDSPRNDDEARRAADHEARIRAIIQERIAVLEDQIAACADPAYAAQKVFELELAKIELQEGEVKSRDQLGPSDYLAALDRTEGWYATRELPYPHPNRLQEQRDHWTARKAQLDNKTP